MILSIFGAVFIPIYDSLIVVRPYPLTLGEFFKDPGHMEAYLSKRDAQVGSGKEAGRMDALVVPVRFLLNDPARLVFGLGVGNATHSSLGPQFTGRYNYLLEPFLITTISVVVSELGLLGALLLIGLHWLIFNDSRVVARSADPRLSSLALAWAGVTLVMMMSLPYKNLIPSASMSFLFWYFSGLIAATRMRQAHAARLVHSTAGKSNAS
jgi:hypothetical protein